MRRLKHFHHRTFQTPGGPRLMGYARGQLLAPGPEEYVRQDVLRTLVEEYGYPRGALLAEEPVARGTSNRRRADVLVRLPGRPDGHVTLSDPSGKSSDLPVYSQLVSTVHPLLLPIRFPSVPDRLEVRVGEAPIACAIRGFFMEHNAIAMYLEPEQLSSPLPRVLVLRVLGYGMTHEEELIARALGIENIAPINDAGDRLAEIVDATLERIEPAMWVEGGLSADTAAGWTVIRHHAHALGVLAFADTTTGEWWSFAGRAMENAAVIRVSDGQLAHRVGLDELISGEKVLVQLGAEGPVVEGDVVERMDGAVQVRCGEEGVLTAHINLDVGPNWLVGRTDAANARVATSDGAEHRAGRTFIVVECKAPHVALTEEVLRQGLDYAAALDPTFLVLTNGREARTFHIDEGRPEEVDDVPDYTTATGGAAYDVARVAALPEIPPLPDGARTQPDVVRFHARYRLSTIGDDVEQQKWWNILTLDDVLRAPTRVALDPYTAHGVTVFEDLGLRYHEPTTPSGGGWRGMYRDFLVRTERGDERIVGLMVGASAKTVARDGQRNSRGKSVLVAALSTAAAYASNLQLDLGRFLTEEDQLLHVWHDGRMTAGRGGVKNALIVEHLAKRQPALVVDGRIYLGRIPARSSADWSDTKDFVARTCAYVLEREELKQRARSTRRARRS